MDRRSGGSERRDRWAALAVLCLPLLIISLDSTVLNVVLPTLVRKLHASDNQLQWIVDAYVLVFGGLMLVSGSVADRVGRKWTFCVGLVVFGSCSTWAAFSGSSSGLIAARASMGVGAALIMPSTLALITDTFADPVERQRALGVWAGTAGAGVALGPVVAGVLLDHFDWGSVFLINVPIALIALGLAIPFVQNSRNVYAGRTDWPGAGLSVVGLALVLWAIIEAPVHGWTSAVVVGAGVGGLAALAVFVAWQARCTHPMMKLRLFANRAFSGAVAGVAIMMFAMMGALFVLTQFLQFQLGDSPLQAGVRMLPAAGGIAVVAPISAVVVRFLGPKLTVGLGLALLAGGLWQISGATITTTYVQVLPGTIMVGVAAGLVMPACTGSLMSTLLPAETGIGSATNSAFVQIGSALGVAIIGSVLSSRYQHRVTGLLIHQSVPARVERTIVGSLGGALGVAQSVGGSAGALISSAARTAFTVGMGTSLLLGAVVALGGAIVALLVLPRRGVTSRRHGDRDPRILDRAGLREVDLDLAGQVTNGHHEASSVAKRSP